MQEKMTEKPNNNMEQGFIPLTPKSDQDRISPYNLNTLSHRQVTRIKE